MTGRSQPCPCGSGKKFKNCCMNKPTNVPSNESRKDFEQERERIRKAAMTPEQLAEEERQEREEMLRLERERVGDAVMIARNKELLLIELNATKGSIALDREMYEKSLKLLDETVAKIAALPLSDRQTLVVDSLESQRKQIVDRQKNTRLHINGRVTLEILEEA